VPRLLRRCAPRNDSASLTGATARRFVLGVRWMPRDGVALPGLRPFAEMLLRLRGAPGGKGG
jgi:hypothetical protein